MPNKNVTKSNGKNETFEKKIHGKEVSHDNHSWAGEVGRTFTLFA